MRYKDTLLNLTKYINRGITPKYTDEGKCIVINQKCVRDIYVDYGPARKNDIEKRSVPAEKFLIENDIVVNSTGVGTLGRVSRIRKNMHQITCDSHVTIVRPDNEKINPIYLAYYTFFKKDIIEGMARGSTGQTELSRIDLGNLLIEYPNSDQQEKIATILSSLDDKIELNKKINKNLEKLAQTLYKQWFVDFEFPNEDGEPYKSSGGEMVESELGLIPKGWEVESIGESSISKLISSGIKEFNGTKKYIATADVTNLSITSFVTEIDFKKRPSRANMQPIAGSLWFAKMKDSRKMIRVSKSSRYLIDKCILSTGFAGLFAPKYSNYIWTILTTKDFDDTKNNLCNGTTMQAINNENINRIKILIPDTKTLDLFESISEPIFEKIQFNEIQSNKLSKIRDELLPKLMNGETEVPIEE